MNLPLHQILPSEPVPLYNQHFDDGTSIMASCRMPANNDSNSGSSERSSAPYEEKKHTQVRIHSIYPLSSLKVCEKCPPNVVSVHPYGKTNLLFLILGQEDKKGKRREGSADTFSSSSASNKIALWDDKKEETVLELVFGDPVVNLVLRRDKLVVVLERRIVLFNLDLDNKDRAEAVVREGQYVTYSNPLGLASIATETGSTMLAFPARQVGHVQLVRLPRLRPATERARPVSKGQTSLLSSESPPYPAVHIFVAHESPLRTLTLSSTGSLLCTSSAKGTLLRVFSTSAKTLVRELRRGSDQADVWSASFLHPDKGELVACASDKRTVHVWKVGDLSSDAPPSRSQAQQSSSGGKSKEKDTTKAFNLLKPYLPAYFSSQWSDLTWRIPHNASVTFHPAHVAALAEQDDIATCLFVHNNQKRPGETKIAHTKASRSIDRREEETFYLLVITRSGAWYKLSTTPQSLVANRSNTVQQHMKERQRRVTIQDDKEHQYLSGAKNANTSLQDKDDVGKKCHMVEYRRIGYGSDGEEDDEDEDGYEEDVEPDKSDSPSERAIR